MAKKGIIVVDQKNVNKDLVQDYIKSCPFKAIVAKEIQLMLIKLLVRFAVYVLKVC